MFVAGAGARPTRRGVSNATAAAAANALCPRSPRWSECEQVAWAGRDGRQAFLHTRLLCVCSFVRLPLPPLRSPPVMKLPPPPPRGVSSSTRRGVLSLSG